VMPVARMSLIEQYHIWYYDVMSWIVETLNAVVDADSPSCRRTCVRDRFESRS
jgi:hypothetical protein